MKLLANLDCEARWAGVALPEAVQRRISLYATLFAACADRVGTDAAGTGAAGTDAAGTDAAGTDAAGHDTAGHDTAGARHDIWLPAAVDPARLLAAPGWTPPITHVGTAPAGGFDLAWADPAAAAANDRSRTLAIAGELGVALPGARLVASLDELDAHVADLAKHPWICKARWTSAGRDRARGAGRPDGELRTRIARMFARFGPLVVEPWLDRVADFGLCGEVAGDDVRLHPPHHLITDRRGGFLGIALTPPVDPAIAAPLAATARNAARRLAAQTGYRGPFAIDAFVYRDGSSDKLHPLCELNARHSFGWIAHGLARRLGIHRLGFDAPPPGATVLIAPGDDGATAWCA